MLRRKGVPHQVLNAKYHEREALIIAQAGKKGAVTIATNMAGRGTDILLGGNPQDADEATIVKTSGGLHVLGSERHESRRIDNQLRGRTGRQGDPGSSRFYLSLEDELMRLFGSERISMIMGKLGMKEGEDIQHPWINKAVENAQRKVEAMNFDIRKQVLDYDNVMNKQREAIYRLRNAILEGQNADQRIKEMIEDAVVDHVAVSVPKNSSPDKWDLISLKAWVTATFGLEWGFADDEITSSENLEDRLKEMVLAAYAKRREEWGEERFQDMQTSTLLHVMDTVWVEHLTYLEQLRKGIFLRAYGQKDPLIEFQKEGYRLFEAMMLRVQDTALEYIFRMSTNAAPEQKRQALPITAAKHADTPLPSSAMSSSVTTTEPSKPSGVMPVPNSHGSSPTTAGKPVTVDKIGRNDPCFCGSGKKYKKCHGK
jgi:preprotein translocase subunit SecA